MFESLPPDDDYMHYTTAEAHPDPPFSTCDDYHPALWSPVKNIPDIYSLVRRSRV
jgi:hypothetical protein